MKRGTEAGLEHAEPKATRTSRS